MQLGLQSASGSVLCRFAPVAFLAFGREGLVAGPWPRTAQDLFVLVALLRSAGSLCRLGLVRSTSVLLLCCWPPPGALSAAGRVPGVAVLRD